MCTASCVAWVRVPPEQLFFIFNRNSESDVHVSCTALFLIYVGLSVPMQPILCVWGLIQVANLCNKRGDVALINVLASFQFGGRSGLVFVAKNERIRCFFI